MDTVEDLASHIESVHGDSNIQKSWPIIYSEDLANGYTCDSCDYRATFHMEIHWENKHGVEAPSAPSNRAECSSGKGSKR